MTENRRRSEPTIIDAGDITAITRALHDTRRRRTPEPMWSDEPTQCAQCGQPHATKAGNPACKGHTRAGKPCGNDPMENQRVCRMHGGKSPRALAAAERRGAEEQGRRALERFGVPRENLADPAPIFVELIGISAGLMDYYLERVREVEDPDALVFGVTEQADEDLITRAWKSEEDDEDGDITELPPKAVSRKVKRQAGPITWLSLYDRERDRLAKLCVDALNAGVQERRVRMAEQDGARFNDALRAILGDLDLTPEQAARLPQVVPARLRALQGGLSA
jgi:hypothetical protein